MREVYCGVELTIPLTGKEVRGQMRMNKKIYEICFKRGEMEAAEVSQIAYEYYQKRAIELRVDVSDFPDELNYMELRN